MGELQVVVQPRFHPLVFQGTTVLHGGKATTASPHCELRLHLSAKDPVPNICGGIKREQGGRSERELLASRLVGRCARIKAVTARFLVGQATLSELERESEGVRREGVAIEKPKYERCYSLVLCRNHIVRL